MSPRSRQLHRAALLLFPSQSLNDATLDRIVEEGFSDVGVGVKIAQMIKGQGFTLEMAEEMADMCSLRGLGMIAFTGYMKYREDLIAEEPSRMMITAGRGKILDLDGMPVRWLCPFRPENKSRYIKFLTHICRWPALRDIHLNDEASIGFRGGVIGCYCDYCRENFRKISGEEPPINHDWNSPLWNRWIQHRINSWSAVHAELRQAVKKVRPDIEVGIQHSPFITERIYSAWESGIALALDARELDLISTDPYHFIHCDAIKHRPHRRVLAEATRSLAGACVNRGVTIYPQGFMPPGQSTPMDKQDGILAGVVPFALGADVVMPFTYELMKIIPGFFEGFDDARKLLPYMESHSPWAFATMINPQQSELTGRPTGNWGSYELRQMGEMVFRTGLPWRWFWDQRLDDAGDELAGPLVMTETHCLTKSQISQIDKIVDRGEGALWVGNTPRKAWNGEYPYLPPHNLERGTFELKPTGEHFITQGLDEPIILDTRVDWNGPEGEVIAEIDGRPALVVNENGNRREAWIAGIPAAQYQKKALSGFISLPNANTEMLRNILIWLANRKPLVRLEPFPPKDEYCNLRPLDYRNVPTLELLPMRCENSNGAVSLLAIIFPYTPVAARTALVINPPVGQEIISAHELWRDADYSQRIEQDSNGEYRIDLDIPGDLELMAIRIIIK